MANFPEFLAILQGKREDLEINIKSVSHINLCILLGKARVSALRHFPVGVLNGFLLLGVPIKSITVSVNPGPIEM